MTKIEKVIWNNLSNSIFQNNNISKEKIFEKIKNDINTKKSIAIYNKDYVFLITPETPYLTKGHIFSDTKTVKDFIQSTVLTTKFVFEQTKTNKIYGMTSDKRFMSIAKKTCYKHEGTLTKSFLNQNNEFVDQYIFAVTREEYYEYMRKLH